MNFKRDFAIGKDGESRVVNLFENANFICVKNTDKSKLSEFDYLVKDNLNEFRDFSIEIKNDVYALKSGNLAFEHYNTRSNKNSGITATKADLWVHIVNDIHIIRVNDLISFVKNNKPHKVIKKAGDGNAALILYKMVDILPIFDILVEPSIRTTIRKLLNGKAKTSYTN